MLTICEDLFLNGFLFENLCAFDLIKSCSIEERDLALISLEYLLTGIILLNLLKVEQTLG